MVGANHSFDAASRPATLPPPHRRHSSVPPFSSLITLSPRTCFRCKTRAAALLGSWLFAHGAAAVTKPYTLKAPPGGGDISLLEAFDGATSGTQVFLLLQVLPHPNSVRAQMRSVCCGSLHARSPGRTHVNTDACASLPSVQAGI